MTAHDNIADTTAIRLERPRAGVAMIVIDSPPRNQLGKEENRAFLRVLDEVEADTDLRCVVLTGTDKSWCSGANLKEQEQVTSLDDLSAYVDAPTSLGAIMTRIEQSRVPVIAAINGFTLGGGLELALCCDIRIASTNARFVCAGVNVGLILSWWRLPRVIGMGRAKEMLLSGKMYDAAKADHFGLVSSLHEPDALVPAALDLAEQIASRAPLSVENTKACATSAFDLTAKEAATLQREKFLEMAQTRDHAEALRSFIEKRPAIYERR
ncbi:enoyl-CoA hydratase [Antricoccus suffuscus]|uniref:Enoyl-CoA hydratase n=1 Tax=Antricoccus suffuscus TaxID=1629062 RepID=A0A2T0ZB19_9ACTN|nr:enoyl-CoA hydratase/isomerase family protein [Antricoccus suffuscus]PRZ33549.1 enoyl-CoA hydratase [Antricoccus suffuscus]